MCEPLTMVMPLFHLPHNEHMLLETARTFKALKIALADLERFYDQLIDQQDFCSHSQLFFPYIDSLKVHHANLNLTYVSRLKGRHIFQATMESDSSRLSRDVVVKFTKRYSKKCHRACYALGISPELFACKRIAGGWYIVVMELLKDHNTLFSLALEKKLSPSAGKVIEDTVKIMHTSGFVHGDLRSPNIMVGPDGSIKIIDFDWAGEWGKAVYPSFLNPKVCWHEEVGAGVKIQPEHDLYLLRMGLDYLE